MASTNSLRLGRHQRNHEKTVVFNLADMAWPNQPLCDVIKGTVDMLAGLFLVLV